MAHQELVQYIKSSLSQNESVDLIRKKLTSRGWDLGSINEAMQEAQFSAYNAQSGPVATSSSFPAGKIIGIALIAIGCIGFVVFALLELLA